MNVPKLEEKRERSSLSGNRSIHILVVEDSASDAALISKLLRGLGTKDFSIEVSVFSDGESAIDYLLNRSGTDSPIPAGIILDINLPKKSGFEVLSEMRKHSHLKAIPVFMLTTSRTHEDILKSYSLDAVSFITKPSRLADFEDVIKRFLAIELPRVLREPGNPPVVRDRTERLPNE